jgi:hypothetical protein
MDDEGKLYSQTYLRTIQNQLNAILNHTNKYYGLTSNPAHKASKIGKSKAQEILFRIWRPLPSSSKSHRSTLHKQKNPPKARTSELFRLLFELNRPMPNGTYVGVRGATS